MTKIKTGSASRVLSLLFVAVVTMLLFMSVQMTSAHAYTGENPSKAFTCTFNKTYTKTWTASTYTRNCYYKVVVPSDGYVTVQMKKAVTYSGGSVKIPYQIKVVNHNGAVIWGSGTTSADKSADTSSSTSGYYTRKIGLAKGTYYINIQPYISIPSTSTNSYTGGYTFKFTSTTAYESESNNTQARADKLTLGRYMTGVYGEEGYSTYSDYFYANVTKGASYQIRIYGLKDLKTAGAKVYFIGPSGSKTSLTTSNMHYAGNGYYYVTLSNCSATTKAYIQITNVKNHTPITYKVQFKKVA